MSHLVLVGRIQLVPRLWVVLLVPEAEKNNKKNRFRASTVKRAGEDTNDRRLVKKAALDVEKGDVGRERWRQNKIKQKFGGRQKGDYGMTRAEPSDLAAI